MMFKRQYHCLIAGLTDLDFDNDRGFADMVQFREELKSILHPSDYMVLSILFIPHDNKNLMAFLRNETDKWDPLGNYSLQDMEEQKRINESILKEDDILPSHMVESMTIWFDPVKEKDVSETERKLSEGYIAMALGSGNRFLKKYTCFDRDMRNISALINSKALGLDAVKYIAGNDPLAVLLRELFTSGKDFRVPAEPEYVPMMFKIMMENEFLEREMKNDLARWNFVNEETFFEYFTIDWLLGYLIKLSIVIRWKELDPETGRTMLERLVREVKTPERTVSGVE